MAKVVDVNAGNFESEVLNSEVPVLVDFWASWCQPCLIMAPILDELSEDSDLDGKVKIVKFNVEAPENQEVAEKYEILSIPNMKVFKNGEIAKEIIGLRSKEVMKEELKAVALDEGKKKA
ncbi:MAG: thioredoxin [Patescibacteria group bacterium]|jgi:thioredoxin 1